eukprot:1033271-Rhodomonas_salina.4
MPTAHRSNLARCMQATRRRSRGAYLLGPRVPRARWARWGGLGGSTLMLPTGQLAKMLPTSLDGEATLVRAQSTESARVMPSGCVGQSRGCEVVMTNGVWGWGDAWC